MTHARFLVGVVALIAPVIPFLFGCACILLCTAGPPVAIFFVLRTVSRYFKKANNPLRSHRDVFLIRYKSHFFPSHWVIFVPNKAGHHINGKNAGPGKVINVEGDVNIGFNLLFKRNYDPQGTSKTMKVEFLASIDDTLVVNPTDQTFKPDEDQALPGDKLEQIALSVLAPRKTLGVRDAKGKPIHHNCQWWTKEYARALVAAGVMPTEALTILDNIPENL